MILDQDQRKNDLRPKITVMCLCSRISQEVLCNVGNSKIFCGSVSATERSVGRLCVVVNICNTIVTMYSCYKTSNCDNLTADIA